MRFMSGWLFPVDDTTHRNRQARTRIPRDSKRLTEHSLLLVACSPPRTGVVAQASGLRPCLRPSRLQSPAFPQARRSQTRSQPGRLRHDWPFRISRPARGSGGSRFAWAPRHCRPPADSPCDPRRRSRPGPGTGSDRSPMSPSSAWFWGAPAHCAGIVTSGSFPVSPVSASVKKNMIAVIARLVCQSPSSTQNQCSR